MKRPKKKNALFSFHRGAMVPHRTEVSARRQRRKASYTPGFLGVKSEKEEVDQLRLMREIAKLGRREKNVSKKKVKRKKKNRRVRVPVSSPKRLRAAKKQAAKRRRRTAKRNPKKRRELELNLSLNKGQKRKLATFLRRATGRRVKVV